LEVRRPSLRSEKQNPISCPPAAVAGFFLTDEFRLAKGFYGEGG
jgi:hypothetical protein